MEHLCPRCGATIQEGSPFCPNCGAAQIHYSVQSSRPVASIRISSAQSLSEPTGVREHHEYASTSGSATSNAGLRAALYAGLLAAVLSSLPLGAGFILAFPFAGFVSVLFYRRWARTDPRRGFALKLGALTGVFGFVGLMVLTAVGTLIFHAQNNVRQALIEAVAQQQARAADPQTKQMLDYFTSPQGLAFIIVFGFIFMGLVLVLLSATGAAVSASLLRRKGPPEQ